MLIIGKRYVTNPLLDNRAEVSDVRRVNSTRISLDAFHDAQGRMRTFTGPVRNQPTR